MAFSIRLQAPSSNTSTRLANFPSGNSYTIDTYGQVTAVSIDDMTSLLKLGWTVVSSRANVTLARDPLATDDNTADFGPGGTWLNPTSGVNWVCVSAATGAAVWVPLNASNTLIGRLLGANMNVTTDQLVTKFIPSTALFRVQRISVTNASISLTTAAGGIYDAASKGGNALVAAGQAYSGLTSAFKNLDLTMALNLREAAGVNLYLSLTTAQGAAATADFYFFGDILAQ